MIYLILDIWYDTNYDWVDDPFNLTIMNYRVVSGEGSGIHFPYSIHGAGAT